MCSHGAEEKERELCMDNDNNNNKEKSSSWRGNELEGEKKRLEKKKNLIIKFFRSKLSLSLVVAADEYSQ